AAHLAEQAREAAKVMAPAIEIRALTKTFQTRRRIRELVTFWRKPKPVVALDGVSMRLEKGELVAILGPNGAGKTTLLKILATLIVPTSGEAFVDGADVVKRSDEARAKLGYVLASSERFTTSAPSTKA